MSTQLNILVTGSSSGFGFLIARTLLNDGHTVFATMRGLDNKNADSAKKLKSQAAETKGRLHLLDMDVTSSDSVNSAVQQALTQEGHIDVVVNNAGYCVSGYAETVTEEQLQRQLDVNVVGVQRVTRAVLPAMRKAGKGLVVNISSVMGRLIVPFAGAYTASKYALEGLSENYRYELAGTGVDVTIIEPGGFGTNFMANLDHGADTDRLESYGPLAELPSKFWGSFSEQLAAEDAPNPQQVADAVLNLIKTPAGQRPLRTVVDPMSGDEAPRAINSTTDQIQSQMFEQMGIKDLLSVKP
jgi:NAD(P)-dependent dehydrogenase (short-subunit alcohol dehydrogenase family)